MVVALGEVVVPPPLPPAAMGALALGRNREEVLSP